VALRVRVANTGAVVAGKAVLGFVRFPGGGGLPAGLAPRQQLFDFARGPGPPGAVQRFFGVSPDESSFRGAFCMGEQGA
jgi:hypothetical protein